jgi:hypothetical protein
MVLRPSPAIRLYVIFSRSYVISNTDNHVNSFSSPGSVFFHFIPTYLRAYHTISTVLSGVSIHHAEHVAFPDRKCAVPQPLDFWLSRLFVLLSNIYGVHNKKWSLWYLFGCYVCRCQTYILMVSVVSCPSTGLHPNQHGSGNESGV